MSVREASHAGSWYSDHGPTLSKELAGWLAGVDSSVDGIGKLPQPGARVIIAPHAGYAYSGPAAAWAYQSLDLTQAKRVFLLGPSHHKYLSGCALSTHATYATPLGPLTLDRPLIAELRATGQFEDMSTTTDRNEHSLEMHLPYIHHVLHRHFGATAKLPPLVPILVGNTSASTERQYGQILAPYLADSQNVFVISSDFCHWGSRFNYTYYLPSTAKLPQDGRSLSKRDSPSSPAIHESIGRIDQSAMDVISSGKHESFLKDLNHTGNTVCGRHPIGVIMAAIEVLKHEGRIRNDHGLFQFVRYERSSEVAVASDSSVSYASAFAVF